MIKYCNSIRYNYLDEAFINYFLLAKTFIMKLNFVSNIEDGGFIRLPRTLVNMVLDQFTSCKPFFIYFWMLTKAAYGTIHSTDGDYLNKGEIQLNINKMTGIFNCSSVYLYRIINNFIQSGLLKKKRKNIYELLMYDKHCSCVTRGKKFVDQKELIGSFREFWKFYYHEVKIEPTDRYRCEQLWAKMKPDEREEAFQFIRNYRRFSDGHTFKKSAYSYLNDKTYYQVEE